MMDDQTYHRLVNSCIDHFLTVLGPRLDHWAEGKTARWKESAADEAAVETQGRAHWQARTCAMQLLCNPRVALECHAEESNDQAVHGLRRRVCTDLDAAEGSAVFPQVSKNVLPE